MNVEANVDRFADWIADILRAHIDTQADQYQLQLGLGNGEPVELNRQQIAEALAKLESMEAIGDTALASSRSYEMLVREEGHFYSIRMRGRGVLIDVQDPDNGLRYILGHPTDEYILFLIYMASQQGTPRALEAVVKFLMPTDSATVESC